MRLAELYGADPFAPLAADTGRLVPFALRALPMTGAALAIAGLAALAFGHAISLAVLFSGLGFAVTVPHAFVVSRIDTAHGFGKAGRTIAPTVK